MCKDKFCKDAFKEFDRLHDYYIGEIDKYKKVLNEIEEYCNKYGQNSIGFKKKILAFIKEVKE